MLKDEVDQSYDATKIIELQSNAIDDMQSNMDLIAEKIKVLCDEKAKVMANK